MKLTELRIAGAKTINLGNYQSIKIDGGVTVAIEDGDDIAKVRSDMQTELRVMLDETYRAQKRGQE